MSLSNTMAQRLLGLERRVQGLERLERWTPVYDVMDWGAKGDGTTDDFTAIKDAAIQCYLDGGGVVYLPPRTYYTTDIIPLCGNVSLFGPGATIYNDGAGPTNWIWTNLWHHHSQQKNRVISCIPYAVSSTIHSINTPTQYDDQVVTATAADAGNYSAGDYVQLAWGTCTSDSNEPWVVMPNIVRTNGNGTTGVIELEIPIAGDATYTTLPTNWGGGGPQIKKITDPWTGAIIGPLTVEGDPGGTSTAGTSIILTNSINGTVRDVQMKGGRAGVSTIYSHGVLLDGIKRLRHPRREGETGVVKALIGGWGNSSLNITNFIDHCWGRGGIDLESTTWGANIGPGLVLNHHPDATEQSRGIVFPSGEEGVEHVDIHDVVIRNTYDGILAPARDTLMIRNCIIEAINKPFIGPITPAHVIGCSYALGSYGPVANMTRQKFRFKVSNLTSGGGGVAGVPESGMAAANNNQFLLQRAGTIIAYHVYLSSSLTSGSITLRFQINGSNTWTPVISATGQEFYSLEQYAVGLGSRFFSANDKLGFAAVGSSFAPSPIDLYVEIEVEY